MSSIALARFIAAVICFCVLPSIRADENSDQAANNRDHTELLHKLRETIIEKIDLHDATPKEALRALSDECIKADPSHRGISFVGHFTPEDSWNKITISLENVSVKEALRHLFPYSVGTSVVSVGYDHVCEGALIKKIYLPNGLFLLGSDAPGLMHMRTYDVSKQFEDRGVNFGLGGSAVYQADERELTVVATSSDVFNQVDEILNP